MILMVVGHGEGHIHDVYLVAIGIAMLLLLVRHHIRARRPWRR
jgi:hypothetical protein